MGYALAIPATTYFALGLAIVSLLVVAEVARRLVARMDERMNALEVTFSNELAEQDKQLKSFRERVEHMDEALNGFKGELQTRDMRHRAEIDAMLASINDLQNSMTRTRDELARVSERQQDLRRRLAAGAARRNASSESGGDNDGDQGGEGGASGSDRDAGHETRSTATVKSMV